ncbi:MAG: TlpA family protein disulfide reductase [Candidatus Acidiferrales bacterium]
MARKLSLAQIAGIFVLAAFTVFITWRAKKLETSLTGQAETAVMVNKQAPTFSLPSLSGNQVSLADYRGKKVVVSFWASWCGPCRMEMPELRSFYDKYHTGDTKFEILAISTDDNREDPAKFVASEKLPFPVLLDLTQQTADAYSAHALPTLYVVNEQGKVIFGRVGYDPTMMQFQLARALGINIAPTAAGTVHANPGN